MIRTFVTLIVFTLFFSFTAAAQTINPAVMETVHNDESKPPGERAVAIVFGLRELKGLSAIDPALEKLGNDAAAYAVALKNHGGFDTVILVQDRAITRSNVMNVVRTVTEGSTPPKYLHIHWAVPVIDDATLITYGYDPGYPFNEGGAFPVDLLGLVLYPMEGGHTVVTFDSRPAPGDLAKPSAEKFSAAIWNNSNSAALSPGPGCDKLTEVMTAAVNGARGRRFSIKELASSITKACGAAPVVFMPVGRNEDNSLTVRLPDSATFLPLGDVRDVAPVPQLPIPEPVMPPLIEPEPIVRQDRKIPRGVGIGIAGGGLILTGIAGYQALLFSEAVETRKTTPTLEGYQEATRQANAAATGAVILGALGAVSITSGLVITF